VILESRVDLLRGHAGQFVPASVLAGMEHSRVRPGLLRFWGWLHAGFLVGAAGWWQSQALEAQAHLPELDSIRQVPGLLLEQVDEPALDLVSAQIGQVPTPGVECR